MTDGWGISCKIALRWMALDLDDKSTLVLVMAWCRQATSHYLSQCWPRFLSPYGVTSPQWDKRPFQYPMRWSAVKSQDWFFNCNKIWWKISTRDTCKMNTKIPVFHILILCKNWGSDILSHIEMALIWHVTLVVIIWTTNRVPTLSID